MEKLRVNEVIVVEGKYDAVKLADLVDALIIPVGGFSVFTSKETKQLLRRLGEKRGLVILTDSDAAGFRIRAYLNQLAQDLPVKNAYIPACEGKEKRKGQSVKRRLVGRGRRFVCRYFAGAGESRSKKRRCTSKRCTAHYLRRLV